MGEAESRENRVASLADLPRFDGALRCDEAALADAADDFGHIVSAPPLAVLEAGSARDVRALLSFAAARRIPVAARGGGHSLFGQSQAPDGIVIDMRRLNAIETRPGHLMTAQAGARWSDVVDAVLPHGLIPPVLTDHLRTSVGGTLSVGGIGGMSHLHGLQTDQVVELDVVTGTGERLTCTPTQHRELFDAVRAGLGQCAVILSATMRLTRARGRVLYCRLHYDDLDTFLTDQRGLAGDPRFDYLEGRALPNPGGWTYRLDLATFHTEGRTPDPVSLLAHLRARPEPREIQDLPLQTFLARGADGEAAQRATGEWFWPHPWISLFVPDSATPELVTELLAGLDTTSIGASGLVLLYPVHTRHLRTPLLRHPPGQVFFQFCLLPTAAPGPPDTRKALAAANHAILRRARTRGAVTYPINAVPMTPQDWLTHFGPETWTRLTRAINRYNPHHILTPGQHLPLQPTTPEPTDDQFRSALREHPT